MRDERRRCVRFRQMRAAIPSSTRPARQMMRMLYHRRARPPPKSPKGRLSVLVGSRPSDCADTPSACKAMTPNCDVWLFLHIEMDAIANQVNSAPVGQSAGSTTCYHTRRVMIRRPSAYSPGGAGGNGFAIQDQMSKRSFHKAQVPSAHATDCSCRPGCDIDAMAAKQRASFKEQKLADCQCLQHL